MTSFDNLPVSQKVRAAIHRDVRAISSETCHFLGLEITKAAMEIIAELVYKKISVYGFDLEAFAKHAKRSTINCDDVKLLVRRNPSLIELLNKISPSTQAPKEKRRKTIVKPVTSSTSLDTPAKTTEDEEAGTRDETAVEHCVDRADPSRSRDRMIEDNLEDFVDKMVLDNTIDLTFD